MMDRTVTFPGDRSRAICRAKVAGEALGHLVRRPSRLAVPGYAGVVVRAEPAGDAVWRYRDDVWRLASQLCRHREDAEDVTHSALVKAAEHLDEFRWEASLRTWLHRIATNECRMLRRRRVPLSLEALLEDAATADRRPPEPVAAGPGPEEAAAEAETRRRVLTALADLPDHYRTALLLKDGLGLHAQGVAQAMGVSVPAVRSILHRARSTLREHLADTTAS